MQIYLFIQKNNEERSKKQFMSELVEPEHFHGEIEAETRSLTVEENLNIIWCSEDE